ncbi:MAG: hypothetical protein HW379_471 [Actinobacteria bacterium]|jgi:hypothetical protein|nr:hypothetical protein [Actinomycetota bacterium]
MRAYLPILHSDLLEFLKSGSFDAAIVFAPTESFVSENLECDEEELEYLLSWKAGEAALDLRTSETSPGIVLALELESSQGGESQEASLTLNSPLRWNQVQCALISYADEDELLWFATQEISQELQNWL